MSGGLWRRGGSGRYMYPLPPWGVAEKWGRLRWTGVGIGRQVPKTHAGTEAEKSRAGGVRPDGWSLPGGLSEPGEPLAEKGLGSLPVFRLEFTRSLDEPEQPE